MALLPLFIVQRESSLVQISLIPRPYLLTRKKQFGRPSRIFGIARDFMTSLTSQCKFCHAHSQNVENSSTEVKFYCYKGGAT